MEIREINMLSIDKCAYLKSVQVKLNENQYSIVRYFRTLSKDYVMRSPRHLENLPSFRNPSYEEYPTDVLDEMICNVLSKRFELGIKEASIMLFDAERNFYKQIAARGIRKFYLSFKCREDGRSFSINLNMVDDMRGIIEDYQDEVIVPKAIFSEMESLCDSSYREFVKFIK